MVPIRADNSILCVKGVKWPFLDRVWSALYEPKAKTATTRSPKAHLALGAHHNFFNTCTLSRVFFK